MQSRQVSNFKINKMTKAQYSGIVPSQDEVYITTDEADAVLSVNGVLPNAQGNVTLTIPSAVTESTVAGWGFTKNEGTVTSVNGVSPTNGNVAITIPTVNNGTLTITQNGNTLGTFGANQSGNSTIDIPSGGTSRNIGEIVASSLPLTDAGLHLLDGALIQGDGIYADFVDYIAGLDLTANYFCTETEWQQSITDYGVCGKFVYDSTNNTVRLPKITGVVEGTTDLTALGDLVEAGLPNITGEVWQTYRNEIGGWFNDADSTTGCFEKGGSRQKGQGWQNFSDSYGIAFNASKSNPIYGNSSTVQPQTIKAFYYIVIATSTKTEVQVDIDNIATDLNGKADTDLTNITDSAKVLMSGIGMPSDTYIDLTLGAAGSTYTAPANGWFVFGRTANSANQYIALSNDKVSITTFAPQSGNNIRIYIPVLKNDNVRVSYSAGGTILVFRFYYAVGSESEAN